MVQLYNFLTSLNHYFGLCSTTSAGQASEEMDRTGEDASGRKSSISAVNNSKSFTIAAILGLNGEKDILMPAISNLSAVMNLSVHSQSGEISCEKTVEGPAITTTSTHKSFAGHLVAHFQTYHSGSLLQDNTISKKNSSKSKRVRTIFTTEQLERLEAEFERQQYMVGPERLYLAHTLQLTEAQVKVWFQNRRIKWRKHHLELTQQRLALIKQSQRSQNPHSHYEDNPGSDSMDTKSSHEDL